MKLHVDQEGCISCGLCMSLCPKVFRFAADGRSEVYRQPGEDERETVREAEDGCPVNVIHTED